MKKNQKFLVYFLCVTLLVQLLVFDSHAVIRKDLYDIEGHWAQTEIEELIEQGIVNGITENGVLVIKPNEPISRSEFVKLIISSLYSKEEINDMYENMMDREVFSDIKDNWAKNYITIAKNLAIINGYEDGSFRPNNPITRAEATKIIVGSRERIKNFKVETLKPFNDVSQNNWAYPYIVIASKLGLVNGYKGNKFKPLSNITRAEAMVIICRLLSLEETINEEDAKEKDAKEKDAKEERSEEKDSAKSEKKYKLTITSNEGGIVVSNTSGSYYSGAKIQIKVEALEGYTFSGWYSTNGGSFENDMREDTVFTMPAKNTEIIADFVPTNIEPTLNEFIQEAFGLDKTLLDNDGDGLNDYFEYTYLLTDLLAVDTDGNGISDADEDYDNDNLTNIEEQEIGTYPDRIDSDNDGLNDYEELKVYNTDPLNVDTDDDGLIDQEEILLGLDPTTKKSDGLTLDSERTFFQQTSEKAKSESLVESDNWLVPSISGNVPGDISRNVYMEHSSKDILGDNRSVVSDIIEIQTNYTNNLTLNFYYKKNYTNDIRNLTIATFNNNGLEIIESVIDQENKIISGEIPGEGTYFVIDLDEFLKGLGIDVFSNIMVPNTKESEIKQKKYQD